MELKHWGFHLRGANTAHTWRILQRTFEWKNVSMEHRNPGGLNSMDQAFDVTLQCMALCNIFDIPLPCMALWNTFDNPLPCMALWNTLNLRLPCMVLWNLFNVTLPCMALCNTVTGSCVRKAKHVYNYNSTKRLRTHTVSVNYMLNKNT